MSTKRFNIVLLCLTFIAIFTPTIPALADEPQFRRISVAEYRDKMKGGWIGQIVGVSWGAPTEFRYRDKTIPAVMVPKWKPEMINHAFGQDDLYVEMTFLRTLELYGLDCSIRQAGIDFANTKYRLWCANNSGRTNLRSGIAPPDSGHPQFNNCPNDIDYQIESDFSGLISPGMPNSVISMGDKFGRLMNYSDGVYAGMFMGGMYAEAFFTQDVQQIIAAGLTCIPPDCQYAEMVRDVVAWHKENPADWTSCWEKCLEKYRKNPEYQKCSNGGIDCKINGAYVLIGLLYGNGDIEQTTVISMRCGQDSDCNPSSAAGVLGTSIGFSKLPPRFNSGLDENRNFSYTAYNFPALLDVCEKLARQIVAAQGGRMETVNGVEYFVIPVTKPQPPALELSWDPAPIANSRFTDDEMAQIEFPEYSLHNIQKGVDKLFPGWTISQCGPDMNPGLKEWHGKNPVLMTHPLNRTTPCVLSRRVKLPADGKSTLKLCVGYHDNFDWKLVVRVNGSVQYETLVGKGSPFEQPWNRISVDLSAFAGQTIDLTLENYPDDWAYEAAYWSEIKIVTEGDKPEE